MHGEFLTLDCERKLVVSKMHNHKDGLNANQVKSKRLKKTAISIEEGERKLYDLGLSKKDAMFLEEIIGVCTLNDLANYTLEEVCGWGLTDGKLDALLGLMRKHCRSFQDEFLDAELFKDSRTQAFRGQKVELRKYGLVYSPDILRMEIPSEEEETVARRRLGDELFPHFKMLRLGTPKERDQARNILVEAYHNLVYWVIKRSSFAWVLGNQHIDPARDGWDYVQTAQIGLICALEKYDYAKSAHFMTYSVFWIRQALFREAENSGSVRLPAYIVYMRGRLERCLREMRSKLGRDPSVTEMSKSMCISEEKLLQITEASRRFRYRVRSQNERRMDDGSSSTSGIESWDKCHFLEEESTGIEVSQRNLEVCTDRSSLKELVQKAFKDARLSEREIYIVTNRFGLSETTEKTFAEIGIKLGLSRERVRQIEVRVLRRLRHSTIMRILLKDSE